MSSVIFCARILYHYGLANVSGPRHERLGQLVDNVGVAVVVDPVTGEKRPDVGGIEAALVNNSGGYDRPIDFNGRVSPAGYVRVIDSVSNTSAGIALIPAGTHGELFPYRVQYRYLKNGRPTPGGEVFADNVVCGTVWDNYGAGYQKPDPVAVEAALTQNGRVPPAGFQRVIENIVNLDPVSVLVA